MRGENKERRLLYNTVRLIYCPWRDANVLSLKGFFHSPPPSFLFLLRLLRFPKELISGMKQAENLFFPRDGFMQVERLGVSFFQRQLACLLKPFSQLTCTVKAIPRESVATLPLQTSIHISYTTKVLSWAAISPPLLKWHKSAPIYPDLETD